MRYAKKNNSAEDRKEMPEEKIAAVIRKAKAKKITEHFNPDFAVGYKI